MFYNLPCVKNQVAFRQLTNVGKIIKLEGSHVPTRLLTTWCDDLSKRGGQPVTNKDRILKNLWLALPHVDDTGSLYTWVFHALYAKYWFLLLWTLKHLSIKTPENPPDDQEKYGEETWSDPSPPTHLPHLSSSSYTTAKLSNRYMISPSSNVKK